MTEGSKLQMQTQQIAAVHLRELVGISMMMSRDEIREVPGAFTKKTLAPVLLAVARTAE